jgi:protein-disulfide isomerase
MASGKKSRERKRAAAAAPPPVRSKGAPRARQASPRVLIGAGAAVAVIAVVVVLVVVLTGGGSSAPKGVPTVGSLAAGLPGAPEAESYFKGIPQKGMTLGSPFAKATMVEYIDLQCPFCQQFDTQVFPDIVSKYVRTGKVKVEMRIVAFIGPDSSRGRKATIAAGNQNKAFNYAEVLYFNQGTENTGWLNDDMVASAAASIPGLNVPKLLSDMGSSAVAKIASTFDADMLADKVQSTPTILVGRAGTKPKVVALQSSTDTATLVAALDAAIAG